MMKHLISTQVVEEARVRVPNREFSTPQTGPFVTVHFLPVTSAPKTLGVHGHDQDLDIMQVTLCEPANSGEAFSISASEKLREAFVTGASLQFESETATVSRFVLAPGFSSEGWWKTPVSIHFTSKSLRHQP